MKRATWFCSVLLYCGVLAFAGCKKQESGVVKNPVANDLKVNLNQLVQILSTNSDAAVQESLTKVRTGLRYGYDYETVLAELDKLNQNASVTEAQKKVVAEVMQQVKDALNSSKPAQ